MHGAAGRSIGWEDRGEEGESEEGMWRRRKETRREEEGGVRGERRRKELRTFMDLMASKASCTERISS